MLLALRQQRAGHRSDTEFLKFALRVEGVFHDLEGYVKILVVQQFHRVSHVEAWKPAG